MLVAVLPPQSSGRAIFSARHKLQNCMPSDPEILLWGGGNQPSGNNAKGKKSHLTKTFTGTVCKIESLAATQMPNNSSKQTAVILMRCGY